MIINSCQNIIAPDVVRTVAIGHSIDTLTGLLIDL